jgi:hypothetical protein
LRERKNREDPNREGGENFRLVLLEAGGGGGGMECIDLA